MRYKKYGMSCFVHGNTGRVPNNKRFDDEKIISFYKKKFDCSPFAVYADMLVETHTLNVSYSHVYTALSGAVDFMRLYIPTEQHLCFMLKTRWEKFQYKNSLPVFATGLRNGRRFAARSELKAL